MARKSKPVAAPVEMIESQIHIIRGQRVMMDSDLAKLYGITTAALNQAVRRNRKRFPPDFAFPLTPEEFRGLLSQIVIAKASRGGRTNLPWVFTEHGVAMLSSVVNSDSAIQVNIEIMRAFIRLRRLMATPGELVAQLTKLAETVQLRDHQIKVITEVLERMLEPAPEAPKRRIGFQVPDSQLKSRLANAKNRKAMP